MTPARSGALVRLVFKPVSLAIILFFSGLPMVFGDAPATRLTIRYTGTDFEGRAAFQLQWNAVPNANYLLQKTSSLAPGVPWETVDMLTPASSTGLTEIKGRSIPENSVEFYRLLLPQPEIFTVEPAVIAPGVTVDLYILGQCFESNDAVRINGVFQSNVVFVSSSTLRPTFTPGASGTYTVQLLRNGVVLTSFDVISGDVVSAPELVWQGPPELPPAAPSASSTQNKLKAGFIGATAGHRCLAGGDPKDDDCDSGADDCAVQVPGEKPRDLTTSGLKIALRVAAAGGNGGWGSCFNCHPFGETASISKNKRGGIALFDGSNNGKAAPKGTAGNQRGHLDLLDCFDDPGIVPWSGEVQQQVVDLAIEGRGLDFVWARTYGSRRAPAAEPRMGARWTHSYDVRCAPNSTGGMDVYDGTGRKDTFKPQTNGTYTCPQFFREGTLTGGVFRLTFADTGYWEFNPIDASAPDNKLARIVDRNGNTVSLGYDGSGRLAQIVDDLGRTNIVSYNSDGTIKQVTDFSGRAVTYAYYKLGEAGGNPGDLKSVTSPPVTGTPNGNDFPSGKTTTYTYSTGYADERENHLLLSVISPQGQEVYKHIYQHNQTDFEFLRCLSIQRWTNTPMMISYLRQTAAPSNHFAVMRCVMNDPEGNVMECFYDARNRCLKLREFTGRSTPGLRVTDVSNRPTGQLRSDDPPFYETGWSWNNDSLCTLEVSPGSQQLQCVFQSDFDKSTHARKRGDLRVVRELACCEGGDLDGDGIADITERLWSYEYDSRFGSETAGRRWSSTMTPGSHHLAAARHRPTAADPFPDPPNCLHVRGGIMTKGDDVGRLLPTVNKRAINTKGTGATVRLLPTVNKRVRSQDGSNLLLGKSEAGYDEPLNRPAFANFTCQFTDGYVTSTTDPRGNLTTATYDANANCTQASRDNHLQGAVDVITALRCSYNSFGQLTAITNAADANGYTRVDACTYYTNGPQNGYLFEWRVDTQGPTVIRTSYEHDPRGNVTRCIDANSNDWLYAYNSLDQCVQSQTPFLSNGSTSWRITTPFSYDANDNLTIVEHENRDENGVLGTTTTFRTQFVYDQLSRMTGCWRDKNGHLVLRCTDVRYDGNDNVVLFRSGEAVKSNDPNAIVSFQYDERRLPYRIIPAPGSGISPTNQFDYNLNGKIKRFSSELYLEKMVFDGFDRLASVEDPMGNQTTFNFDANDNLTVLRHFGQTNDIPGTNGNIRLVELRYQYDGLDRLVTEQALHFSLPSQTPVGDGTRTTTWSYAPNGQCLRITDDLGHSITNGYDTVGRKLFVADSSNNRVVVNYDALGNVLSAASHEISTLGGPEQVFSSTNVYDPLSRCVSTRDSVGNSDTCYYDSRGLVVRAVDAAGNVSSCTYDGLGRATLAVGDINRDGILDLSIDAVRSWTRDDNDRLTAETDSNSHATTYTYDSLDRCTLAAFADGTHRSLIWSPRSNLIHEQDPNGTQVEHSYDLNDRCTSNHFTPGVLVSATTTFETFTYDGCSRLASHHNDVSDGFLGYDSHGNCVSETVNGLSTTSTYDSLGNQLSLTYPGGRTITYVYDALNRCISILETGKSLVGIDYDGPARVSKISYGNGMRTRILYDGISGTPNAAGDFGFGQVSLIRHALAGGSPTINEVDLAWDRNGNKATRADAIFAPALPRTNNLTLHYDGLDRLTRATVASGGAVVRDTVYGLDRVGNRTNVAGAACAGAYTLDGSVAGPRDFQVNQYTTTPCDSRSYDDDGNLVGRALTSGSALTYAYDCRDRLVGVSDSGSAVSSYSYDALGRRIVAVVFASGIGKTDLFLYDGTRLIEQREGGAVAATFVLDGTRSHDSQVVTGFTWRQREGPFAMRRASQDYYFHADDQGNTLALTDSGGNAVERYDYDDYGAVTFLTSDRVPTSATSSSVGNVYLFGGMRLDAETGLDCDDRGGYLETTSGRYLLRAGIPLRFDSARSFRANNPWSGGSPAAMQKGKVKFFNETKGFGIVVGPDNGGPGENNVVVGNVVGAAAVSSAATCSR